jgi:predicted metal-dependent HD superfamily phosphohydrolase
VPDTVIPEPTPAPIPDLCALDGFVELCARSGVSGADARRIHADLVERHRQPHRRYHTLDHVAAVLGHLDITAEGIDDRRALELATWFHDAVYDPSRPDNEAASAALARAELLAAGADQSVVDDVVRLVAVTADHRATTDDEHALCDADLAVLGAGPEGYAAYREAVRAEYDYLDDELWQIGRSAVLRSLLAGGRLFHCPAFAARAEQARRNLADELADLET